MEQALQSVWERIEAHLNNHSIEIDTLTVTEGEELTPENLKYLVRLLLQGAI